MTRRHSLTEAELDRIADLTERRRLSSARIAIIIGCSVGSVTWAQLKIGADKHPTKAMPPVPTEVVPVRRGRFLVRPYTQAEDDQLLSLARQGLGPGHIGKRLHPPRRANSVVGRMRTLARRDARAEAIAEQRGAA